MKYVALLRGINVGGKNKVAMSELKACFETLGHTNVTTYINSGNVIFSSSDISAHALQTALARQLKNTLGFPILAVVISEPTYHEIIRQIPKGFGSQPLKYHSDVVFLIDVSVPEVMAEMEVHPEVDKAWAGQHAVYYQRLSAKRTKSRLSKVVMKPIYKSLTIRSWNTAVKLDALLDA